MRCNFEQVVYPFLASEDGNEKSFFKSLQSGALLIIEPVIEKITHHRLFRTFSNSVILSFRNSILFREKVKISFCDT